MARFGIVTTWFDRGAAYVSRQFRDTLKAAGHEVFIYARGGEATAQGDPFWDGPKVHWAKRLHATYVDAYEFDGWFQKNQIDAVLFNEQQDWAIVDWCVSKGIPIASYIDYYRHDTVERFGAYNALVCNTRRHHSVFKWHPNCHHIPWGTDVALFRPQPKPEDLRYNFVFFHNGGMLGVNGRKGTSETVQAFLGIADRYPEALLVIHTQVPIAVGHPQVKILAGNIKPPGLYHFGDVYVYPSKLEGIGLTVPEALASGLPVITTDAEPMKEFVEDCVTGRLVKVERTAPRHDGYYWPESFVSIKHLAELMEFYIHNREVRDLHGESARKSATERFDWSKSAPAFIGVMEGIL